MRLFIMIELLALVLCLSAVLGQQYTVSNVSPTPDEVVPSFLGPTNLSFSCDIRDREGAQVLTAWYYRLPASQALTAVIPEQESGITISGTPRPNSTIFPTYNNVLHISELSRDLDRALLICGHAIQEYNQLASWSIRIFSPPVLTTGSLIRLSEAEQDVLIDIQSTPLAFPTPTDYQWSRDGVTLSSNARINFSYGFVRFSSLLRSDSGTYSHSAANVSPLGQPIGSHSGGFTLEILYGPELSRGPGHYVVREGEPLTMLCGSNLQANPQATAQWTDNSGQPVNNTGRFTVSDGPETVSLRLSEAQESDSGLWRCSLLVSSPNALTVDSSGSLTAREDDTIGQLSVDLSLIVVVAPSQPTLVEIRPDLLHPTNATLSWRAPVDAGHPGITEYLITADDGGSTPLTARTGSNRTSGIIEGLSPGTQYLFSVQGVARVEDVEAPGSPSPAYQALTPTTVPSVECSEARSDGGVVVVSWLLSHTGGLPLTSFSLLCCGREPLVVPETPPTARLAGLPSGRSYSITVRASNSQGASTATCPPVHHTIGVPSGPSLTGTMTDSSSVILSMNCFSYGVPDGSSFYYDLSISGSEVVPNVTVPVPGGGSTQYTFSHLTQGHYLFSLACRNSYGSSPTVSWGPLYLNGTSEVEGLPLGPLVGGVVAGLVVLLVLIVLVAVVVAAVARRCAEGGKYSVHRENLYLSPNHNTRVDSGFRGVRVEEIPVNSLLEQTSASNGKDLHYADLGSFQDRKLSEEIPGSLRVTYSTIDMIKTALHQPAD